MTKSEQEHLEQIAKRIEQESRLLLDILHKEVANIRKSKGLLVEKKW